MRAVETGSLASTSSDPSFGRELRVWTRVNLHHLLVVVVSGVGAGELVTVRRENMKLNIAHGLNTWMTHMKYSKLLTTVEKMTRNKYLLWTRLWLSKSKQRHTSVSVPLLCGQIQGCQGGGEQEFTQANAWSWHSDQYITVIHTCCSRCCVFCRGWSETREKTKMQVKNCFPSAGQGRDTHTQTSGDSQVSLEGWTMVLLPRTKFQSGMRKNIPVLPLPGCGHVAALGAWGCSPNTSLGLGLLGQSARTVPCVVRAVPAPRGHWTSPFPGQTHPSSCTDGKCRKADFLGVGRSSANLSLCWCSVSAPSRVLSSGLVFLLSLLLLYCVWKPKERQGGLSPILILEIILLWGQGISQSRIRAR